MAKQEFLVAIRDCGGFSQYDVISAPQCPVDDNFNWQEKDKKRGFVVIADDTFSGIEIASYVSEDINESGVFIKMRNYQIDYTTLGYSQDKIDDINNINIIVEPDYQDTILKSKIVEKA